MHKRLLPICLMGAALESIWLSTRALGPLRDHSGPFIALMLASFALCFWSYLCLTIEGRRAALLVAAFGLLFRLTVLSSPPYESEDVYRYLWDARMASMSACRRVMIASSSLRNPGSSLRTPIDIENSNGTPSSPRGATASDIASATSCLRA